jgi:hypothetical protein
LLSRETSYVAIERRETPVVGDVQLRRVPIALTSGWGGLDAAITRGRYVLPDTMMLGALPRATVWPPRLMHRAKGLSEESHEPIPERASIEAGSTWYRRGLTGRPAARAVPAAPPPAMHALVALQRADGSWDLTTELADIIGLSLKELESALRGATGKAADARRAWATALALIWLRTHGGDVEGEWKLLAAKARRYLDDTGAVAPGRGEWMGAAARFLGHPG